MNKLNIFYFWAQKIRTVASDYRSGCYVEYHSHQI